MFELIFFNFTFQWRPGADQAHFAAQNVKKLRQFVEAVFPKKSTDPCDTRIVCNFKKNAIPLVKSIEMLAKLVRVFDHGAELEARKDTSTTANPLGDVKYWTFAFELDCEGDGQHGGRCQEKRDGRKCEIRCSFERQRDRALCVAVQRDKREGSQIFDARFQSKFVVISRDGTDVQTGLPRLIQK